MNDAGLVSPQDRQSPLNVSARFARAISWIGHPLVFVTLSVGVVIALRLPNRVGVTVLLALLLSVIFPTALLLFRGVRSGRWSDADVSVRKERNRFYPMAITMRTFLCGRSVIVSIPWRFRSRPLVFACFGFCA